MKFREAAEFTINVVSKDHHRNNDIDWYTCRHPEEFKLFKTYADAMDAAKKLDPHKFRHNLKLTDSLVEARIEIYIIGWDPGGHGGIRTAVYNVSFTVYRKNSMGKISHTTMRMA